MAARFLQISYRFPLYKKSASNFYLIQNKKSLATSFINFQAAAAAKATEPALEPDPEINENKEKDSKIKNLATEKNLNQLKRKDFYTVLGVNRLATNTDLRAAFKEKAVDFHPDKNPDNPIFEEFYKVYSEAYTTLTEPTLRRKYDDLNPLKVNKYTKSRKGSTFRSPGSEGLSSTDKANDFINRMNQADSEYFEEEDDRFWKDEHERDEQEKRAAAAAGGKGKYSDKGMNRQRKWMRRIRILHSKDKTKNPKEATFSEIHTITFMDPEKLVTLFIGFSLFLYFITKYYLWDHIWVYKLKLFLGWTEDTYQLD